MAVSSSDLEKGDYAGTVERLRALRDGQTDEREAEEEMVEHSRRLDVMRSWGVPLRVTETIGQMVERPMSSKVAEWFAASRDAWCLVLSGGVGTGKSTAAGWWLWQLAEGTEPSPRLFRRWWTAPQLMRADGYDGTVDRLAAAGPLVLDDIGSEYSDLRGAMMTKIDGVLDERYGNYRRTLICTNLNATTFRERYGDRVADRINDATKHGGGFWEHAEPSMRGK